MANLHQIVINNQLDVYTVARGELTIPYRDFTRPL